MIPARSGLILEGQGQARLHLKFNDPWSHEWGPVHSNLTSRRITSLTCSGPLIAVSNRRGSAERADDFAVSGLRERLQRFRAHEAEAPELQDVTGHDGVVRRLADSDKVELAHHHIKLLHLAAHLGK